MEFSEIHQPNEIYSCPVPVLDNYDAAATLVSLINSKVNEKISRASANLTETSTADKTELQEAITEGDASTLATARAYSKSLQTNVVKALTTEEVQEIDLENGESLIYFDLTTLNLVKKSKSDQGEVTEQIYGKLVPQGDNPE